MPKRRLTVLVRSDMLRSWLLVAGWTQSDLAEALTVSKGRVSQLLGASGIDPSAHLIANLLKVTGMPFERLFRIGSERLDRRRPRNGALVVMPPPTHRRRKRTSVPVDAASAAEVA